MAITITEDVASVLKRCDIDETSVTLPNEDLDRKLYVNVDKVLKAYGGKWNRSKRCHVFKSDPREKLAGALETGKAVDEKREMGQFFTPPEIVEKMVDWAELDGDVRDLYMLEPSAGDGRILKACAEKGCNVRFCELSPELFGTLNDEGFVGNCGDFLSLIASPSTDRILMNPPFANNLGVRHVLHAWEFLKPGGILVAILPSGFTFRSDRIHVEFKDLMERYGEHEGLPHGTFKEAGTNVNTVIVKLTKP